MESIKSLTLFPLISKFNLSISKIFNGKAIVMSSHSLEKKSAIDIEETVIDVTPFSLNQFPISID